MTDLPGELVDFPPLPPGADRVFGYRGDARFVGFRWSSLGDELTCSDGVTSGSAQSWAFLAFKRHPAIRDHLADFDLGSSEGDGAHMLLIDRERGEVSVAPLAEAREFLAGQHPPPPALTPEQQAEFEKEMDRLMKEWRETPIDHEAIAQQMKEQRNRMAAMLAFLDQQVPPGQGEGHSP